MPRPANAVDFWRGFALVSIFINHIPGLYYSRFTHVNISISDSADLFVFLAGWSVHIVVDRPHRQLPIGQAVLRLSARAFTIYVAQVFITTLAIAILAAAALILHNPLLLEWHNAAAVFYDPVRTHIGLVLITHHLGYFDILPLYVALMAMAPGIAIVDRYLPNWLLPLSIALYCVVLAVPISVPTWPVEGRWNFNPLAWQLIFVLGYVFGKEGAGAGAFVHRHIGMVRLIALPIVIAGSLVVWFGWWPDPTKMPQPRLFFIADKTFMTPMRLIQFLALVAVFSLAFPHILRLARPLAAFLSMLGRNSLHVFCIGSLLSLIGQIVRYLYKGYVTVDTVMVVIGILVMALTAWLVEWRERAREPAPARSSQSA